jgi:gamma-glutamyltranspeptidase/glutathione hydrolase
MGGDAQPQIVLQMFARLLHLDQSPGEILSAGRFNLASPDPQSGFDTWTAGGDVRVQLEPHAAQWEAGLRERGHQVEVAPVGDLSGFGHAHLIQTLPNGALAGAADPRAKAGAALGR